MKKMVTKLLSVVFLSLSACIWNFSGAKVIVSNKFERQLQEPHGDTSSQRSAPAGANGGYGWGNSDLKDEDIGSANPFCHPITFRDRLTDLRNVADNCLQELVFDDCCQPRFLQLTTTGVYPIEYGKHGYGYCDMTTDGGGWIVVARRAGGKRSFDKTWKQYKRGFGPIDRDFWIGLDSMFKLTRSSSEMRVELIHPNGSHFHAHYDYFSVGPETLNYVLTIKGYNAAKSNTFDAFSEHNGAQFTTKDRNNIVGDEDLVKLCWRVSTNRTGGGWWYLNGTNGYCYKTNLNEMYFVDTNMTIARGVPWYPTYGSGRSYVPGEINNYLVAEIKIRPKSWVCGQFQKDWGSVQRLFFAKATKEKEEEEEPTVSKEIVDATTAPLEQ